MSKKYKLKNMTEKEKMNVVWNQNSESLIYNKTLYYACQAVEYYGAAVRDNTFKELVYLGKEIEKGNNHE